MASLGELFVELGIFADVKEGEKFDKKLKEIEVSANKTLKKINENAKSNEKLNTSFKGLVKGLAGVVTAVTGAALVLNKFTNDLVQSNQALLNLTRTSDIAQGTFQKWNNVGKMLGVENAAQQIEGLNQRLFQLMLTGEGATGFQLAGINPIGQDAEGVMEQIRTRIVGMNDTAATYLLQQMGLDQQMLHLLRLTREEFEALGQTVKRYQLSPEQTKQIQAMNVQLQIASIRLKYLKDRAILAIMPAWTKLVESFARVTEMLMKWGKAIGDFTVKWRGLVGTLVIGLSRIAPIANLFKGMAASLGGLIIKIPVFGRALAALGGIAARALLPFTALYLLLDDLAVFLEGGDSLTGDVLAWAKEQGGEFGKIFGKMFGGDLLGGAGDLFNQLISVLEDILNVLNRLIEIILGFNPRTVGEKLGDKSAEWLMDKFPSLREFAERNKGNVTGGAASLGYIGALPDVERGLIPHTHSSNTSNQTTTTNSIAQTNYIQTNQTGESIKNQLVYLQSAFAGG